MHLKVCFVSNRAILPSAPSGRKGVEWECGAVALGRDVRFRPFRLAVP